MCCRATESYDFVHHWTDDGKTFRTLNILDEHSRECLAIRVKRRLNSAEVIDAQTDLFILREAQILIDQWNLVADCFAFACRSAGNTTTQNDRIVLWATARRLRRPSFRW